MPTRAHDRNIANFSQLITACHSFGPTYKPQAASINIPFLETLLQKAQNAMQNLYSAKTRYQQAVHARHTAFLLLRTLATRITNTLIASGIPMGELPPARSLLRKIQNEHNKNKSKKSKPAPTSANTRSVSRQSYISMAHNFHQLVLFATAQPLYKPNEPDLQAPTLNAMAQHFFQQNTGVAEARIGYKQAMISRNETLYDKSNGLLLVAANTKKYLRSVFGYTSLQFKIVSKLVFD